MSDVLKLSSPETGEFWEIQVLFQDDDLLALNKPAGLLTAPDPVDANRPSLIQLLHHGIGDGKPWARQRELSYLMHARALDFEVSGVILLARNKPALVKLADLFGSEKPVLRYIALVQGQPGENTFSVEAKLAPDPVRPEFVRINPRHGKRARTQFHVRERFDGWTLLTCEPLTARPHQIRVHLKSLRLPIVADPLYGGKPLLLSRLKDEYHLKPNRTERPLVCSLALHAEELSLAHPVSGTPLTITAPWPKDLQVGVKYLRRYAALP